MRNFCVMILILLLGFDYELKAEDYVTLIHPAEAQVFINGKVVGSATLPVGREYKLLGSLNDKSLLQAGSIGYLVDPHDTNYNDLYLLKPLGLTHRTAPPTAIASSAQTPSYVPDVSIYPSGGVPINPDSSMAVSQSPTNRYYDDPSAPIPSASYFGPYVPGVPYYYPTYPTSGYYTVYPHSSPPTHVTPYIPTNPVLRPTGPSFTRH